jgi:two-component system, OmpR family, response regulator ResD
MASTGAVSARRGNARQRVLVVDDEHTIAEILSRYLERAGYDVRQAFDGPAAVGVARSWNPDLVVLDVMLPGFDGLEVMRRLRDRGAGEAAGRLKPAVILLTARAEESDRIAGLRRGADDYVVKPFSTAEVVARVDAVLRRATRRAETSRVEPIAHDGLVIDPACRTVEVDGREVPLTALEFDLLAHLAAHPGRVFTRDQLMESVWNTTFFADTSTVTVHVRRLRGKIEQDPARPRYIETARGVGYRFRAAVREPSGSGG